MARLVSRELCQRTCLKTGAVTFHTVEPDKSGSALREVTEATYRQIEAMAETTDCFYSQSDRQFRRAYKTVRYSATSEKGVS